MSLTINSLLVLLALRNVGDKAQQGVLPKNNPHSLENDLPVFRGYVSWELKGTPTMPPSPGNKAIKMLLTTILLGGTIDSQDSRVLFDVMRHGNATSPGPTSMTSVTGRATYARPGLRPVNSKQLEEVRMGRVTSKITVFDWVVFTYIIWANYTPDAHHVLNIYIHLA